jgi:hypothetical protein
LKSERASTSPTAATFSATMESLPAMAAPSASPTEVVSGLLERFSRSSERLCATCRGPRGAQQDRRSCTANTRRRGDAIPAPVRGARDAHHVPDRWAAVAVCLVRAQVDVNQRGGACRVV